MQRKQGTIVSGIWLLPGYRKEGAVTLSDYRASTVGDEGNTYGFYGGYTSYWNFGVMCLGKIAKEANCDLVLWTDPYTERLLRMEEHQFVFDFKESTTKDYRLPIQEAWNTAKIKYFDLDSSSVIPHERFLQQQHNIGTLKKTVVRDVGTPYYSVVVSEKPNLALHTALECNTEQVYWIDTHMWSSSQICGLPSKTTDAILQTASGTYYTTMHDTMKHRPTECAFITAGNLMIAGGVFGGTRDGVVNALSAYKEHFPRYVSSWCNTDHIVLKYDSNNTLCAEIGEQLLPYPFAVCGNVTEQYVLTDLHRQGLLRNSFVSSDPDYWNIDSWPNLIKRTHESM